jgi:hypothetical protein
MTKALQLARSFHAAGHNVILAAFAYFWHGWQHWLMTQRETVVGLVVLVLVICLANKLKNS